MNVYKRAVIYLKRNKKRTLILTLILIMISTVFITCFSVWQGCQNEMKKLQNEYGNSFVIETLVGEDQMKDFADINGRQMSYYVGPVVDKTLVEKIMSLENISDVCHENIMELVAFQNIKYVPGLFANDIGNVEQIVIENAIRGYSKTQLCREFQTNIFELIQGRHINEQDTYKIMISDTLAQMNDLQLGDKIEAEINGYYTEGNPEIVYTRIPLEVVGIFHVNANQIVGDYTPESDILENYMLTDFTTAEELKRIWHEGYGLFEFTDVTASATFFIDSSKDIEEVINLVQSIREIEWDYYTIKIDDSIYQSALVPLKTITQMTAFMMVFVLVVCVILLVLILKMWTRTRKREIGILLSVGNTSRTIVGQLLTEGILILVAAFVISIGVSTVVKNHIGNTILLSINTQNERVEEMKREKAEADKNNVPSEIEEIADFQAMFDVKTEIAPPDEISCQVTGGTLLATGVVMIIVLVITVWIGGQQILKLKLREILM